MANINQEDYIKKGRELAAEFQDVDLTSIRVLENVKMSILDAMKLKVEALTGEAWDWWPMRPPYQPIEDAYS